MYVYNAATRPKTKDQDQEEEEEEEEEDQEEEEKRSKEYDLCVFNTQIAGILRHYTHNEYHV